MNGGIGRIVGGLPIGRLRFNVWSCYLRAHVYVNTIPDKLILFPGRDLGVGVDGFICDLHPHNHLKLARKIEYPNSATIG